MEKTNDSIIKKAQTAITKSKDLVLCQEKVQIKYALFSVELPC